MSRNDSQAPAGVSPKIRFFMERMALLVTLEGPEFEKGILAKAVGNPYFSFLLSSDPNHEFYQKMVSEAQSNRDGKRESVALRQPSYLHKCTSKDYDDSKCAEFKAAEFAAFARSSTCKYRVVCLPRGITRKDFYTIGLTAQFVAEHGLQFERSLIKRKNMDSRFEFLKPTHRMADYFRQLADSYTACFRRETTLTACTDSVLEVFLRRLQNILETDPSKELQEMEIIKERIVEFQEELHKEGRELALVDFHESVSLACARPRKEPQPKRPKFDDSSLEPKEHKV